MGDTLTAKLRCGKMTQEDTDKEVQYAEITLRVAATVPKAARTDDRMNIIRRLCENAPVPAGLELRPSRQDVTLHEVESMKEVAMRKMEEAESESDTSTAEGTSNEM